MSFAVQCGAVPASEPGNTDVCGSSFHRAGFLFGFDTVVISGADQKIQTVWSLGATTHGLCMSAALWGTVLGALLGGIPTERFGRKKTLLWVGILYFVSAIGSALAPDQYSFMIARFIGGVGVGIATVASPLYIAEISPPALRGRLAGINIFRSLNPEFSADQLSSLADTVAASVDHREQASSFLSKRLRIPIMLAFLIAFFNQLSGINAILYFAPRIFEWTGLGENAALLQSVGIGITNLIFTYVGLWLIDRVGRRTLLYIGSFGYIASLGLCAWAFQRWPNCSLRPSSSASSAS